MNEDQEARLQALLDRQEVWDCLLRYSRGVDRLDPELVKSAFWADAHDSHGALNGPIEEFLSAWIPTQGGREACQHLLTNHAVTFDGSDTADAETYFLVAIKDVADPNMPLMGGRYIDRFEKRGGEWRIRTRLCLVDWQARMDASEMADRRRDLYWGRRDHTDPSYERPVRPRYGPPNHLEPQAEGSAQ